ncbi:hypothetical protein [Streptomyces sp. NPDC020965]|uniref:hypothetical protein n=1 Tax=Streptomyces sp. NPDC020965 TaxID=3365105 RepID=UPI0037A2F0FF
MRQQHPPAAPHPSTGRRIGAALVAAGVSAGAYALFIPWDLRNRAEPGEIDETSPVSVLGVVALAVVLVAAGALLGKVRVPAAWAGFAVGTPVSVLMLISFLTHEPKDASPWPVVWVPLTVLAVALPAVVAVLVSARGRTAPTPPAA